MSDLLNNINEAVSAIRASTPLNPEFGIILGTGLGKLAEEFHVQLSIDYRSIPHFPVSTVESHSGKLIFGTLAGKQVVAMQGRFHFYEGYSMQEITFPVRVMHALGVRTLFVSNACGGMNAAFRRGDIMIITDHINLLPGNPLIGVNEPSFGPRFPDMSEPYNNALIALGRMCAAELNIPVKTGVYVSVSGPSIETRAEYRFLITIGADAVGMSTVPEVIVARQYGMKVFGISVVTDECHPDSLKPATLKDILYAAAEAEPKLTAIVKRMFEKLPV